MSALAYEGPDKGVVPENPVKRLCKEYGYSTGYISRMTGISKNTLYFVLSGAYTSVPDKLHLFLMNRVPDYDINIINEKYENWKYLKRRAAYLPPFTMRNMTIDSSKHPLVNYLESSKINFSTFCLDLAIHKPIIHNYTVKRQYKMPDTLYIALRTAGISKEEIALLDKLSHDFYSYENRNRVEEISKYNVRGDEK